MLSKEFHREITLYKLKILANLSDKKNAPSYFILLSFAKVIIILIDRINAKQYLSKRDFIFLMAIKPDGLFGDASIIALLEDNIKDLVKPDEFLLALRTVYYKKYQDLCAESDEEQPLLNKYNILADWVENAIGAFERLKKETECSGVSQQSKSFVEITRRIIEKMLALLKTLAPLFCENFRLRLCITAQGLLEVVEDVLSIRLESEACFFSTNKRKLQLLEKVIDCDPLSYADFRLLISTDILVTIEAIKSYKRNVYSLVSINDATKCEFKLLVHLCLEKLKDSCEELQLAHYPNKLIKALETLVKNYDNLTQCESSSFINSGFKVIKIIIMIFANENLSADQFMTLLLLDTPIKPREIATLLLLNMDDIVKPSDLHQVRDRLIRLNRAVRRNIGIDRFKLPTKSHQNSMYGYSKSRLLLVQHWCEPFLPSNKLDTHTSDLDGELVEPCHYDSSLFISKGLM